MPLAYPNPEDKPPRVVVVDVVVVVAATGACEARGGWWGGLSVPKPPKGVAEAPEGGGQPLGSANALETRGYSV